MLILTRRIGESVVIDGNVNLTVLNVRGNQVRIGIKAPKNVSVHRKEIGDRQKQGAAAKKIKDAGFDIEDVRGNYDFSKPSRPEEPPEDSADDSLGNRADPAGEKE